MTTTFTFYSYENLRSISNKLPHRSIKEINSLIKCTMRSYDVSEDEATQYLISNRDTHFLFSNGRTSPPRPIYAPKLRFIDKAIAFIQSLPSGASYALNR